MLYSLEICRHLYATQAANSDNLQEKSSEDVNTIEIYCYETGKQQTTLLICRIIQMEALKHYYSSLAEPR